MRDSAAPASVLERVSTHLPAKAALTVLLVAGVSLPFFLIEYFPLRPAAPVPLTAFDRWLGFDDGWVWAYFSLYLYMPIVPLLMVKRSDLRRYAAGMMSIAAAAFAVFLIYPTEVLRPDPEGTQFAYRWLVALDRPTNAVPSLHCAFAVFTALGAGAAPGPAWPRASWLAWSWVWCATICLSTLVTKQHQVIDVASGCALGLAGHALVRRGAVRWAARATDNSLTDRHLPIEETP